MTVHRQRQFLEYVRNTNGGARQADFIEDWEPIGARVWAELLAAGLVMVDEGSRIRLTAEGDAALLPAEPQ